MNLLIKLIISYLISLLGHVFDNLCWFDTDNHWVSFKKMNIKDKTKFVLKNKLLWIATNTRDVFSTLIGSLLFLQTPTNFWFGWIYASFVMMLFLTTNFLFWFKRDSFWEMFGLRDIIPSIIIGLIVSLIL